MGNNKISYLNRNFDDYKNSLKEYVAKYYPQIAADFNDASIGSWLIDLVAAVGDNLSYYIDRALSETNVDTATRATSIYNIARSNGFKVPGPKASMAEVVFSCVVPVSSGRGNKSGASLGMPDMRFAPIIKRGTKVASRNQVFEVLEDINFSEQFNKNGVSNRQIIPLVDSNKNIINYRITKTDVVYGGESKIYKQELTTSDIVPFMEVLIPDTGVMNVESVIFKDGADYKSDPTMGEFMIDEETLMVRDNEIHRFFEVNSLVEQYRWGDAKKEEQPETYTYGYINNSQDGYIPVVSVTKGEWKPLTQKFITEFTDKGYLKIIFGSGEESGQEEFKYSDAGNFSKYQITKMIRNNFMGRLPKAGWTMYVLYRVGGGAASNVAAGAINNITYLNAEIGTADAACDKDGREKIANVKNSLTVTNTTPSISGKDAPTVDELKAMIKYNNAAQERCVTVKDYENRIAMMPPRYGCPFRVSAMEENNKIKIFMLGLDYNGKLSAVFPEMLIRNMMEYLSQYRTINDFVVIEAGEIIHLSFEVEIFVDRNYNNGDVAFNVIDTIKNYMDINKHQLGEDIFVGDLEREVSNVDGVLNLIDMRVYNKYKTGGTNVGYSPSRIAQNVEETDEEGRDLILLSEANYVLNSNVDSMFEINNPDTDIIVKMKVR